MKRTMAATEKVMRDKDDRIAERLRGRGWVVFSPETVERIGIMPVVLVDNADDGNALPSEPGGRLPGEAPHPCIPVCSDPAAHAEGGHDV